MTENPHTRPPADGPPLAAHPAPAGSTTPTTTMQPSDATVPDGSPAAPTDPDAPPARPRPRLGRRAGASLVLAGVLLVGGGGGFAIGRATAPDPTFPTFEGGGPGGQVPGGGEMPQPPSDRQGDGSGSGADEGSGGGGSGTTDDGSSATDSSGST
jgi:hypothetical protein